LTLLSELELDALKEFINIGFGRAAGELSDIINLHVILNVPDISIMDINEINEYVSKEIKDENDYSIIEQFFIGTFKGTAFLVLPHAEGKRLLNLFSQYDDSLIENYGIDVLEKETLIEIGNIIISACVGKVAEILQESVTYSPPRHFCAKNRNIISKNLFTENKTSDKNIIVSFKTVFNFEDHDVTGYLFLISQNETLEWIKKAIKSYLDSYE
jgi:chemotaxis protein CheC